MNEPFFLQPSDDSQRKIMYISYGLFGLGIIFGGLPAIAGVILAYIKREDMQGTAYYDHMCFLIRTFWGNISRFCFRYGSFAYRNRYRVNLAYKYLVCFPSYLRCG